MYSDQPCELDEPAPFALFSRCSGGVVKCSKPCGYRWKFSCLHFAMKNKSAMLEANGREVVKEEIPSQYQRALQIE